MNHMQKTLNMAEAALSSANDFLADADESGLHGQAEVLKRALDATVAKLRGNEPSPASQAFYEGTYTLTWSDWSPRIGVDLEVLHWRLFDLEGRNYHHKDDCHWDDWPDSRYI